MEHMREKYFRSLISAEVHFKRVGSFYGCTITYKATGFRPNVVYHETADIQSSLKGAQRKLDAQLKRLKKLKVDHLDHHARPDKPIQYDGEHRVDMRHVPPQEPEHDLTTMGGADDYAKAMMQREREERERARHTPAETSYRIAAE